MKIAAVVVTFNRLPLLPRALQSIAKQNRKPDFVFVVSNSNNENFKEEKIICNDFGFALTKNLRTHTYTGALNTSVEEIIKHFGIEEDVYFASLDDDDEWLPDYLQEIENNNTDNFDLLIGNLLRKSETENKLLNLPTQLTEKDFLTGNPGVCGSNTFIRLTILLQAGCFDEALPATADRDFFVRVFQQNPTYKIINKHLVTQHTDNNRPRITINKEQKTKGFQVFYYKYQHLMSDSEKETFFARANNFFAISREEIEIIETDVIKTTVQEIQFKGKGNYQFVMGFIAGNEIIAERIAKQIVEKNIPVDLVVIIDDTPKGKLLDKCEEILKENNTNYKIIGYDETNEQLKSGYYGEYFERYPEINSIPLGRTILHHHLYTLTVDFSKPVYWIIDDDISFNAISTYQNEVNLFELVNTYIDSKDAIIGGISNDPPVPTLSCIRAQLVDFLHSQNANNSLRADFLNLKSKTDYYYDLSDIHTDHLEIPIYHHSTNEDDLKQIFAGKSLSRPALQRELKADFKTITKRGANTLVFNREILKDYPVINLEVNNKLARRGDLLWALFNQLISGFKIIEHTFCVNHSRPVADFNLKKELDKSAYDIIGYAFNKGLLNVIESIKLQNSSIDSKDIFEEIVKEDNYHLFEETYNFYLQKRRIRFLMNYYRIIGLCSLLSNKHEIAKKHIADLSNGKNLEVFEKALSDAKDEKLLKEFLNKVSSIILNYSQSI